MNALSADPPVDTSTRLLAVAREVFSEHGFQGATIREICRRAEVNLAAVNYHFSSKEALFVASLDFEPLNAICHNVSNEVCAKARLQCFIKDFITQLMDEKCSQQCQLMMSELVKPTVALDMIVQEVIAPIHHHVSQLVRDAVGVKVSAADLRRSVFSIMGQCLFYRHSFAVIQRLHPKLRYDTKEIAATAQHITEFSLAGLAQVATRSGSGSAHP